MHTPELLCVSGRTVSALSIDVFLIFSVYTAYTLNVQLIQPMPQKTIRQFKTFKRRYILVETSDGTRSCVARTAPTQYHEADETSLVYNAGPEEHLRAPNLGPAIDHHSVINTSKKYPILRGVMPHGTRTEVCNFSVKLGLICGDASARTPRILCGFH
jgi:hypothetical protein